MTVQNAPHGPVVDTKTGLATQPWWAFFVSLASSTSATVRTVAGAAGQLPGTGTNDNASSGNVGEYISSTVPIGSEVITTGATPVDVTSIKLTGGDWDVWGQVAMDPSGASGTLNFQAWISTVSSTNPGAPNNGAFAQLNPTTGAANAQVLPTGQMRISVPSGTTQTVYLSTQIQSNSGTPSAYGFLGARRAR